MAKAVFAGCARSCAPFLDGVLANIEALGFIYDAFEVIIVENDSADDTRRRLQEFASSRTNVRLIDADGLDKVHPRRGDRLAVARNLYMDVVREAYYSDCDDLIVIDFDDVNCRPIDRAAFEAARSWLWQKANRRGVFANSAPFYYDLWPLRHPTWCPDDCWKRVRKAQRALGLDEAVRRHVASRQIPILPETAPIMVDSAFGGLGIYKREATLGSTYVGLDPDNEEVCDHVSFNAAVKGSDGVLAIYPALQNQSPIEHIVPSLRGSKVVTLEQNGAKCALIGPPDSQIESFRASHPLFGQRLPTLASIVSNRAPEESFVEIGASIGDTIALARLAGATMPAIATDASVTKCKYLWANLKHSHQLFGEMRFVWGGIRGAEVLGSATSLGLGEAIESPPIVRLAQLTNDGDVSLLKTNADGFAGIIGAEREFLTKKAPIFWIEAQTVSREHEGEWREFLVSLATKWTRIILFDNFGFAIAAGDTNDLVDRAIDLMAYARRQRDRANYRPTLYYLDIALFPQRFEQIFDEFRQSLPEMDD